MIIGPNMSGKSALLRAIRLVISNLPGGSEFISWGEYKVEVTLECDDNVVTRIKGNRTNEYILDGSTFSGFGRIIPEEVINALGTTPIQVDGSQYELNYADAHAAPFLVSETDSVKGKLFTQLAASLLGDLSRLDSAITNANSRIRAASIEGRMTAGEIEGESNKLASFESLVGVEKKLAMCHKLLDNAQVVEEELDTLSDCRNELSKSSIEIAQLDEVLDTLDLTDIQVQEAKIQELITEIGELKRLDTQYKQVDLEIKRLKRWEAEDIAAIECECADASILASDLEALKRLRSDLRIYNSSVDRDNALYASFSDIPAIDFAREEYASLLTARTFRDELANFQKRQDHEQHILSIIEGHLVRDIEELTTMLVENKTCPVCLSTIDEECIASIIQEITDGQRDDHSNGAGDHSPV